MITLKKLKTTFYLFKLQYIKDLAPPFLKGGKGGKGGLEKVLSHNKIPA
jgi:hypothetical protein